MPHHSIFHVSCNSALKNLPIRIAKYETFEKDRYYCRLRSYIFFLLFYVFFDVESESEVSFCRSPLFFEL